MFRHRPMALVCAAGLLTAGALWGSVPATATEDDMAKLPVTQPFLCATCHVTATPITGNAGLNPFGDDFLDNGRSWDLSLASQDSDEDECTNGFEVGDVDGDGEPDGNVETMSGNPGEPGICDSGGLTEERTWSALKAIFDGS